MSYHHQCVQNQLGTTQMLIIGLSSLLKAFFPSRPKELYKRSSIWKKQQFLSQLDFHDRLLLEFLSFVSLIHKWWTAKLWMANVLDLCLPRFVWLVIHIKTCLTSLSFWKFYFPWKFRIGEVSGLLGIGVIENRYSKYQLEWMFVRFNVPQLNSSWTSNPLLSHRELTVNFFHVCIWMPQSRNWFRLGP